MSLGQDALENALSLVSSRDYTVTRNDSPASIAKKFGVSMDQLLNANPQKPTTVVRGVRTWTDLSINEGLNLPKAGVRVGYVAGVGQAGTAECSGVQRALNKLGEYCARPTLISLRRGLGSMKTGSRATRPRSVSMSIGRFVDSGRVR